MRSLSKLLVVGVGVIALYSVQACTAGVPEADLNPQPLPPTNEPARDPNSEGESADSKNGGGSMGTGTSPAAPPSGDAGTDGGDAAGDN